MSDTNETTTQTPGTASEGTQTAGTQEQVTTANGRVLNFTDKSIGALKRAEQRRGADALARKYGYENAAAMDAALAGGGAPSKPAARTPAAPPPKPATQPGAGDEPPLTAQERRELAELREKNKRLADEKAKSDRIARESRRKQEHAEVESALKVQAHRAGIEDVDYALTLYSRHIAGKSEAELKRIDSKAYFAGLKTTHPHLFITPATPAAPKEPITTGTGGKTDEGAAAPATPGSGGVARPGNGAGAAQPGAGGSKSFDARNATREQVDSRFAELGLQNPAGASF